MGFVLALTTRRTNEEVDQAKWLASFQQQSYLPYCMWSSSMRSMTSEIHMPSIPIGGNLNNTEERTANLREQTSH